MTEETERKPAGEEIRSPLQVVIRVLLAVVVTAVLVGLILAVVLRPERTVEPPEGAGLPVTATFETQLLQACEAARRKQLLSTLRIAL